MSSAAHPDHRPIPDGDPADLPSPRSDRGVGSRSRTRNAKRVKLAELPAPTQGALDVAPWIDPEVEAIGHDPRSSYVELYWLGILGPSSTFLIRRLGAGLVHSPDGFRIPIADTAQGMGLGAPVGRQSPFIRALHRCCQFRLARWEGEVLQVRRKLPPLRPGQVNRLPESLQHAHAAQLAREVAARRTAVAEGPRVPLVTPPVG